MRKSHESPDLTLEASMVPANSYDGMLSTLRDAFKERYCRKDVNITGILFARPESHFAQKDILPYIDYWHHRSDCYTDFFCPGYELDSPSADRVEVATVGGSKWYLSNEEFVQFLEQLEAHTSWHYSGGCELLVTNARYDASKDTASLDLSTAIAIDLETAQKDKAFRDVTGLSETIFQFAKNLNEATDDPCWEFSDRQGLRLIKGSLKEFLLHYLPKWLKPEAQKAFHFYTRNLELSR
jgi:hypothetical protein